MGKGIVACEKSTLISLRFLLAPAEFMAEKTSKMDGSSSDRCAMGSGNVLMARRVSLGCDAACCEIRLKIRDCEAENCGVYVECDGRVWPEPGAAPFPR